MKEQVICAAIWYKNDLKYLHQPKNVQKGVVICGRRHHNCVQIRSLISVGINQQCRSVEGFITTKDRFVDRKEAAIIAYDAGQVEYETLELFSENLY